MTKFFTSDLHFGHSNAIKHSNRPFDNVEEMNASLIDRWNKTVSNGDDVYILGDVSFCNITETTKYLTCLNGTIYLIAGNHDSRLRKKEDFTKHFVWVKDLHELAVEDADVPGGKQHIVLCHYPLLSWHRSHYGSWMLHGHCHGNMNSFNEGVRRFDCGVDCTNYAPISYAQLKQHFQDIPLPVSKLSGRLTHQASLSLSSYQS